jgi:hypothetical protein
VLRSIRSLLALAVALGSLLAVAPTTGAHAACAAPNRKSLSGAVNGSDGRKVNVFVGLDVFDKANRPIRLDGCLRPARSGYTTHFALNKGLAPTGGPPGRSAWRVTLPANAAYAYVETYPKNQQGITDLRHYGHSMRRKVPAGTAGVALILPVVCGEPGGLTGGIHGYVTAGGRPVRADRVRAWSMLPDTDPRRKIMGWNIGEVAGRNFYRIHQLARNQPYVVWVTYNGRTIKRYNVHVAGTCRNTAVSFAF